MRYIWIFILLLLGSCVINKRIIQLETQVLTDTVQFFELSDSAVIADLLDKSIYNLYLKKGKDFVKSKPFLVFPMCNCKVPGLKKRNLYFDSVARLHVKTNQRTFESNNGKIELERNERLELLHKGYDSLNLAPDVQYVLDKHTDGNFMVFSDFVSNQSGNNPDTVLGTYFKEPILQVQKIYALRCKQYYHEAIYGRKL